MIHPGLLATPPGIAPFVVDSADGRFTGGVLPTSAWNQVGAPGNSWVVAHQLIPGMMLTDAIRKSGF